MSSLTSVNGAIKMSQTPVLDVQKTGDFPLTHSHVFGQSPSDLVVGPFVGFRHLVGRQARSRDRSLTKGSAEAFCQKHRSWNLGAAPVRNTIGNGSSCMIQSKVFHMVFPRLFREVRPFGLRGDGALPGEMRYSKGRIEPLRRLLIQGTIRTNCRDQGQVYNYAWIQRNRRHYSKSLAQSPEIKLI